MVLPVELGASASGSAEQCVGGQGVSAVGGSALAFSGVVLRPDCSPGGSALGDSDQGGFAVTAEGRDLAFKSTDLEPLDLAAEWCSSLTQGLSTEV